MKFIPFLITTLIIIYSCSPINKQHGYILEDLVNPSNLSQFKLETTVESDILQTLGSPSIIISDVNNIWIYLVSIKKENIFEDDDLIYQNIMRYEFDNDGKLLSKEFLNEENFTEISFTKDKTKIISGNYDLADQIYETFTRGL
jgi:outer membrane protein assembly factor BamE (lipoprotein component of BamABCDE complex)|tara:strand:+ start:2948 stop:3379 length:432 start_codon:yes stop_codon:yes gene_type:complete